MGWGGDDNAAASANMRSALGGIGDFILRNQQWKVQKPNVEAQTRNTNASTDLTTAQTAAAKQAVSQGAESFPVALDQNKVALSTARLQNEMVGAQNQYNMSRLGYMGGFFGQGQNGVVPAAQGAATDAGVGAATAGARAMGAPVPNFSLTPPRAGGITTGAASPGSSASTGGPSQTIGSTPAPVADVSPVLGVDKGFNPELQVPPIGSGALLSLMQPGGAAPFAAGGKWTQEAASKATGVMKDAADAQSAESAATIAKRNAELGDPAEREKVLQFSNNAAHASHVLAQLDETVHKFGNFESSWAPGSNKVAAGNLTALPLQLADSLSKVVNPGAVLRNGMVEAQKEYNVPLPEHSWTAPFTSNVTTRQGIHLTKVMLARYIQNYENSPSNRGPVTGLTPEIRASVKKKRPPLPPACALCRPHGGHHRNYGTDDAPQMARCDCPRGKALGMGTKWGREPKKAPAKKVGFPPENGIESH